LQLESKAEVKKRIKRSPDFGDALALTFAYPLGPAMISNNATWKKIRDRTPDYCWSAYEF